MTRSSLLRIALLTLVILLVQETWVLAGTTGRIEGKVTDQNGKGITYELYGIALNHGFDFYNGTTFNTNGITSLQ